MAYILKLHSAGRLSGDDSRRPALSFNTFDEAFDKACAIFSYLAENTKAARGFKSPRVTIADSTGRGLFVGRLSTMSTVWGSCFCMECRQPGAAYSHWREPIFFME